MQDQFADALNMEDLSDDELEQLHRMVGLTEAEIDALMSYPTNALLDILTAQARVHQALSVLAARRNLKETEEEIARIQAHREHTLRMAGTGR